MRFPQILWVALIVIELVHVAAKDGKEHPKYSFEKTFTDCALTALILWWGGFFA